MLNKLPNWSLVLLPGILLWLAWPPMPLFFLLFAGFIPLFELDRRLGKNKKGRYFLLLYLSLFIWNIFTTWWVWNSSAWGCVTMLIFNSLFMTLPWLLMRYSRRFVSVKASQYLFIIFWLLFEFLHLRWELSWPWLTLGNGFSNTTWFVQWYEYTGVMGGSFLVLLMNLLLYRALSDGIKKPAVTAVAIFGALLLVSLVLRFSLTESRKPALNVVVLQPSFDPWNEKFVRDPADMISEMIRISEEKIDSATDLLVWPETSLVDNIEVAQVQMDYQIRMLRALQKKYPKMAILTGANMQQLYPASPKRPNNTARPTNDPQLWWDAYNSAIYLENNDSLQVYHKSKLVPGTEQMPLTTWIPSINDLAVKLDENSTTGSLGSSPEPVIFGKNKITPAICYESIYGDYLAKFARKGAGLIAVVTNDAWWGKTEGYRQHMSYARLRAIEERKWVVRSANTGTSCFIDPAGKVHQATEWYKKTAIAQRVGLSYGQTIYTRIGDLPIVAIMILSLMAMVYFSRK